MSVKAKFLCIKNADGQIELDAVYDSNPESENGKFFKATPSGRISMGIVNEDAANQFEKGKEYYVTFDQV